MSLWERRTGWDSQKWPLRIKCSFLKEKQRHPINSLSKFYSSEPLQDQVRKGWEDAQEAACSAGSWHRFWQRIDPKQSANPARGIVQHWQSGAGGKWYHYLSLAALQNWVSKCISHCKLWQTLLPSGIGFLKSLLKDFISCALGQSLCSPLPLDGAFSSASPRGDGGVATPRLPAGLPWQVQFLLENPK